MAVLIADAGPTFWHTVYLWIKTAAPSPKPELVRVNPDSPLDCIRGLDPLTLARIHDQFYPEVYRYVRYRLEDEQVCEDITSEVFLRLLQALQKQEYTVQNLRGWLFKTAANLLNDHLRARYARPVSDLGEDLPAPAPSPEGQAERAWQNREVREALQQLTPDQQHVLALRFTEDRPLEETAQLMGKSVSAVKTLQFRALAALRRRLGEKGQA